MSVKGRRWGPRSHLQLTGLFTTFPRATRVNAHNLYQLVKATLAVARLHNNIDIHLAATMSLAEPMSSYQPDYAIGFDSPPNLSPTFDTVARNDDTTDNMSSLHYTFTPTRPRCQPRAWERKASTPYLSRHDAQKIWKRVPLQSVSANVNATWRKGDNTNDGVMRPVKKLRTNNVSGLENKENCDYVTSKWEKRDEMEGTPRRRQPQSIFEIYNANAGKNSSPTQTETHLGKGAMQAASNDTQPPPETGAGNKIDGVALDDASETFSLERFSPAHQYVDPQLLELDHQGSACQDGTELNPASLFHSDPTQELPKKEHTTNNLRHPCLERGSVELQSCTPSIVHETSEQGPGDTVGQGADEEATGLLAQADHDDTSYLQKFLLRAQAQRVAKSQEVEAPTEQQNVRLAGPCLQDTTLDKGDEDMPYKPDFSSQESNEEEGDSKASLDYRRSARAITRLPRLQKPSTTIPSNISLRRLNGSEFISMQKDIQNLALTTRANTKKNKCTAISVRQRLMQLQVEVWQDVEDEKPAKKTRKAVAWAETLARFQNDDGKEVAVEAALLETTNIAPALFEETAASEEAPLPLQPELPEPETAKESKKRVRRQRKANSGTENGTPAPKRTMEMMVEAVSQPQTKLAEEKIEKVEKVPMKQIPRKTRTSSRAKPRNG